MWRPAWHNSNVIPPNARLRIKIPTGNAHVVFAKNLFALDVDADEGLIPYEEYVAIAGPTLSWRSPRGPKAVLRLPDGAPPLGHSAHPYPGLEILTHQALAPGSTRDGFYYAVETLHPIATISMELAVELADLAPYKHPTPHKSGMIFVVQAAPFSRQWRSDQHKKSRPSAATARLQPTAEALRKRAQWGNETRKGERMRAVRRIATQMARYDETYEAFKTEILTHPVRKALEGRGDTDVVLGRVWEWAQREVAATPVVPRARTSAASGVERPTAAALAWWTHAQAVIDNECPHLPQRNANLSALVRMQASWLQRYGFEYSLSYRALLAYLDLRSHKRLTTYIEMLENMQLLRRRHDKRTKQVDGMRWTLMINNVELTSTLTPAPLINPSSFPPADRALIEDEEIDWLLDYARRVEDDAALRARQNARSERVAAAQELRRDAS